MTRVHDDTRLAGAYHSGNAMPEASLRAWAEFVASFAPRPAPAWLDVGAGTGMFCAALDRYQRASRVVGVEPSPAMLRAAREATAGGRARLVAGTAERLPLADGAFDIALLSRVVHHLPDRPAAARELARVLRPAGVVVLRTTFRERLDALVYDYWPRLRATDGARFPGQAEVLADFAGAGLTARTVTSFAQPVAASLGEYATRLRDRPQSKFGHLSPAEFAAGLERMRADAVAHADEPARAVCERYDVAVLARG
ncbi:class I SAM-dependent methyltransferase [Streptomyces buecherae]|uniref:class I SAM-dependent methyltransferase n=1 Tax=Streptomyces buecherae TaxID=2763006 RepID=UPI001C275EEB|nr:class I SAM-dependent methyltransferase [Streptomyces buecherae]